MRMGEPWGRSPGPDPLLPPRPPPGKSLSSGSSLPSSCQAPRSIPASSARIAAHHQRRPGLSGPEDRAGGCRPSPWPRRRTETGRSRADAPRPSRAAPSSRGRSSRPCTRPSPRFQDVPRPRRRVEAYPSRPRSKIRMSPGDSSSIRRIIGSPSLVWPSSRGVWLLPGSMWPRPLLASPQGNRARAPCRNVPRFAASGPPAAAPSTVKLAFRPCVSACIPRVWLEVTRRR